MPVYDHVTDHSTLDGAQRLAQRLESFWANRGYSLIRATVIQVKCPSSYNPPGKNSRLFFGVQTNIGPNGYPPKHQALAQ